LFVTLALKSDADPATVGYRIAGREAIGSPAYPDRRPRENLLMIIMLQSIVVTVPPGREARFLDMSVMLSGLTAMTLSLRTPD
jgi:hypothetical protein